MKLHIARILVPKSDGPIETATFEVPDEACGMVTTRVRSLNDTTFEVITVFESHEDHVTDHLADIFGIGPTYDSDPPLDE